MSAAPMSENARIAAGVWRSVRGWPAHLKALPNDSPSPGGRGWGEGERAVHPGGASFSIGRSHRLGIMDLLLEVWVMTRVFSLRLARLKSRGYIECKTARCPHPGPYR